MGKSLILFEGTGAVQIACWAEQPLGAFEVMDDGRASWTDQVYQLWEGLRVDTIMHILELMNPEDQILFFFQAQAIFDTYLGIYRIYFVGRYAALDCEYLTFTPGRTTAL